MLESQMYGLGDLNVKLKKASNFNEIKRVMKMGGFMIEGTAKTLCRAMGAVDTGRLMGSISTSWSGKGGRGKVHSPAKAEDGVSEPTVEQGTFIVRIGTNVDYAPFVHYGTRSMAARPFLEMAAKLEAPKIQQMINSIGSKEQ